MSNATLLWDGKAQLGEGPLWVEREQALYFVDIVSKLVIRVAPDGTETGRWHFDAQVTAIAETTTEEFLVTTRHGLARWDASDLVPVATLAGEPSTNRCNDAKLDPHGRFWFGTMDEDAQNDSGALYRFDQAGEIVRVDSGYRITNGPAFSLDGATMFHTDSVRRTIYAFDIGPLGEATNRRVFKKFEDLDEGAPDGMTVDAENCLWVCHFGGARVSRFSPKAELLDIVELPVPNVTSCTFGGPNNTTMYITTARIGIDDAELATYPLAGGVFTTTPGVTGVSAGCFSGSLS